MKAKILTLGCTVNYSDSIKYSEVFANHGIGLTSSIEEADFCLVNTCTVTLKANRKSRYLVRKIRKTNPDLKLIVSGCYPSVNPTEVAEKVPGDIFLNKAAAFTELDDYLKNLKLGCIRERPPDVNPLSGRTRMFIKIQDGCDNFCTFCIIPQARGRESSRSISSICEEVRKYTARGYQEFCFSGVCLGRYGKKDYEDNTLLIRLLEKFAEIPGVTRIRFGSIDANDMDVQLFRFLADFPKFCRHFHIPLQSGSDKILMKMRRSYNSKEFIQKIDQLKNYLPDASLATDLIVGFPGEEEEDFQNTINCIKRCNFFRLHVFPYSKRPKTVAYKFKEVVPDQVKALRCQIMQDLDSQLQEAFYKKHLGKKLRVLLEDLEGDEATGHTDDYCPVRLKVSPGMEAEKIVNKIFHISFDRVKGLELFGRLSL
ncbi:tRNA (N(6)-L-threonylcarbamoyladenosine(37)-C(2))-methylthiotransferase MtaB [Candidatus Riflebacteria bacterium]